MVVVVAHPLTALEIASSSPVILICARVVSLRPQPLSPCHPNQLQHAQRGIVDWEVAKDQQELVVPTTGIAIKYAMEMVNAPAPMMERG
jgi:hypothetical protein